MLRSLGKCCRQPFMWCRGPRQDFRKNIINPNFECTAIRLYSPTKPQSETSSAPSPPDVPKHTPLGTRSHKNQPPSLRRHKNKKNEPNTTTPRGTTSKKRGDAASVSLRSRVGRREGTPAPVNTDRDPVFAATTANIITKALNGTMQSWNSNHSLTKRIKSALPDDHPGRSSDQDDHGVPQGCPNDPSKPPLPFKDWRTFHRYGHADFDRYRLANSPDERALFAQWKKRMSLQYRRTNMAGHISYATSWAFAPRRNPFTPRYPLTPLPHATRQHLRATRRRVFPEFVELLKGSTQLTLGIEEELMGAYDAPADPKFARTYVCHILEVDSRELTVPYPHELCVKIFDDSISAPPQRLCSRDFRTEEEVLQNEEDVYLRLRHAWGSAVPFYYGAHLLSCPDGRPRYCILTERVLGPDPDPEKTRLNSFVQSMQISFIESARHAVCVLQRADVTGFRHILETGSVEDHSRLACTIAGFEDSRQGSAFHAAARGDDYAAMGRAITRTSKGTNHDDGLLAAAVRKWYAPREPWDDLASAPPQAHWGAQTGRRV